MLLEREEALRAQGYMIDFFGPGWQVAERMQLITKLKDVGYRIPKVVWMSPHHRTEASLDYALLEKMSDGKFISIMRGDLERSLFEGLPQLVDVRFGSSVQAIETRENGITVLLTNGAIETADLLIGADGIHSRIRDLIFGKDPRFFRYLGYHTAALTFNDGDLNRWLASECKIISAPGIEAGFYPLRNNNVGSFFVCGAPDMALPPDPVTELKTRYREFGWPVQIALDAASWSDLYYDQVAQIELSHWSKGRVVLKETPATQCHCLPVRALRSLWKALMS